jgi:hypothetical protein
MNQPRILLHHATGNRVYNREAVDFLLRDKIDDAPRDGYTYVLQGRRWIKVTCCEMRNIPRRWVLLRFRNEDWQNRLDQTGQNRIVINHQSFSFNGSEFRFNARVGQYRFTVLARNNVLAKGTFIVEAEDVP